MVVNNTTAFVLPCVTIRALHVLVERRTICSDVVVLTECPSLDTSTGLSSPNFKSSLTLGISALLGRRRASATTSSEDILLVDYSKREKIKAYRIGLVHPRDNPLLVQFYAVPLGFLFRDNLF